jgi:hypothetical protein
MRRALLSPYPSVTSPLANGSLITSRIQVYGIYYNPKTGQCVQLANANDRVDSAVDIHTHPKCK